MTTLLRSIQIITIVVLFAFGPFESSQAQSSSLIRSTRITGQIKDANGNPVPNQIAYLTYLDQPHAGPAGPINNRSDKNGNYSIQNVPPGKYMVAVGTPTEAMVMIFPDRVPYYRETFHPGTTDFSKATIVEVAAGSEVRDVDVVLGKPIEGFDVNGRIVSEETGAPVPNVKFYVAFKKDASAPGQDIASSNWVTDAYGNFKIRNALPGQYVLKFRNSTANNSYADPTVVFSSEALARISISFEVKDRPVTGLEVKVHN